MLVSRYSKHWILKLCIYNTICIFLGQNKSGGNNMAIADYNNNQFLHFKILSSF
jgi:hypothetical protein